MNIQRRRTRLAIIISFVLLVSGAGAATGTLFSGSVDTVSETSVNYGLIVQQDSFSSANVDTEALVSVSEDRQSFGVEFEASAGDTVTIKPPFENRGGTPLIMGLFLNQTDGPPGLSINVTATGVDEFGDTCEITDIVSLSPNDPSTWHINVPGTCQDRVNITVEVPQSASGDYFRLEGTIEPVAEGTTPGSDANDADGDLIPDPIDSTPFGNLTATVNDTSRNPGEPVRINVSAAPPVDDRFVKIKLVNTTNGNGSLVTAVTPELDDQGNASADLVVPQNTVGNTFVGEAVLQKTGNVSKPRRTARTDTITIYNGSLPDADDDDIPDSQDPTPFGGLSATANVTSITDGDPVRINVSAAPAVDNRFVKIKLVNTTNGNGSLVASATPNLDNQGNASADLAVPQGTAGSEFVGEAVLQKTGNASTADRTATTDTITVYNGSLPDADDDNIPDGQDPTPFGGLSATANVTSLTVGDPVKITASADPDVTRDVNITLIKSGTEFNKSETTFSQGSASVSETFRPNETGAFNASIVLNDTEVGAVSLENRTANTSTITVTSGDADGDGVPDSTDPTPFGNLTATVNDTSPSPGDAVRIDISAAPAVQRTVNISLVNTTNGNDTAVGAVEVALDSQGNASEVLSIPDQAAIGSEFLGEAVLEQTGAVSAANRTATTDTITVAPRDADGDGIPDSTDPTPFGNLTATVNDTSRNPGDPVRVNVSAAPAVQRTVNISLVNTTNGNDTAAGSTEVPLDSQGNATGVFPIPDQAAVGSEFVGEAVLEQTGAVSTANRTATTDTITVYNGSLPDADDDDIPDSQDPDSGGLVVFAQNGDLRSLTQDGTLTFSYGIENNVKALGPSRADFDADPNLEIPVVVNAPNQNGKELLFVDDTGEVNQATISGVKPGGVAVGSFDGSPESVFFTQEIDDDDTAGIYRFTPETATGKTKVKDVEAQVVVGVTDIDGDSATEIVYGGSGPDGNSETINYIDDDRTLVGTQKEYGTDDGAGLGVPADFDGDGVPRIPYVNENQNIALLNASTGTSTVLTSGESAKKAPIATTDWDSDGTPEIMFLATDGKLKYVDNVTGGNNLRVPVDENGDAFSGIDTAPGLRGGLRATAQTQTSSRTNADEQTHAVYVQNGNLVARNESGTITTPSVTGTIEATGGPLDLTDGPAKEYPVVLSANSGTLKLNGSGTALTTDIKTQPVAVRSSVGGPGQFAVNAPSIYHTRSSDGAIVRTQPGGTNATYTDVTAQIVAGPADIDGDDAAELVFGGDGPTGNSQTVNYIDDDGSLEGTQVSYGSDNAAGVGEPGDFDGDGIARVPVVNDNNDVVLVDGAGRTETLVTDAKKSTLSVVDFDNDSELEIVYISTGGTLKYIDDIETGNPTSVEIASGISANSDVGVR